ncbi:hypothetical protein PC116_g6006 [Phytophthora cactorum]|nr:hypothetical protein PC116_g6006 [Phytophthora cactorum]
MLSQPHHLPSLVQAGRCGSWLSPLHLRKGYQQEIKAGYTNLLQHLKAAHNGYENVMNPNGTLQPAIT